ncbi:hypothetical protein ACFL3D_07030, partial [Candidatus Omnitrophota bacterium]
NYVLIAEMPNMYVEYVNKVENEDGTTTFDPLVFVSTAVGMILEEGTRTEYYTNEGLTYMGQTTEYLGVETVDIPDGMGGTYEYRFVSIRILDSQGNVIQEAANLDEMDLSGLSEALRGITDPEEWIRYLMDNVMPEGGFVFYGYDTEQDWAQQELYDNPEYTAGVMVRGEGLHTPAQTDIMGWNLLELTNPFTGEFKWSAMLSPDFSTRLVIDNGRFVNVDGYLVGVVTLTGTVNIPLSQDPEVQNAVLNLPPEELADFIMTKIYEEMQDLSPADLVTFIMTELYEELQNLSPEELGAFLVAVLYEELQDLSPEEAAAFLITVLYEGLQDLSAEELGAFLRAAVYEGLDNPSPEELGAFLVEAVYEGMDNLSPEELEIFLASSVYEALINLSPEDFANFLLNQEGEATPRWLMGESSMMLQNGVILSDLAFDTSQTYVTQIMPWDTDGLGLDLGFGDTAAVVGITYFGGTINAPSVFQGIGNIQDFNGDGVYDALDEAAFMLQLGTAMDGAGTTDGRAAAALLNGYGFSVLKLHEDEGQTTSLGAFASSVIGNIDTGTMQVTMVTNISTDGNILTLSSTTGVALNGIYISATRDVQGNIVEGSFVGYDSYIMNDPRIADVLGEDFVLASVDSFGADMQTTRYGINEDQLPEFFENFQAANSYEVEYDAEGNRIAAPEEARVAVAVLAEMGNFILQGTYGDLAVNLFNGTKGVIQIARPGEEKIITVNGYIINGLGGMYELKEFVSVQGQKK